MWMCECVLLASPSRRPSKFALSTHKKFYSCICSRAYVCTVWTKTFVVLNFWGYISLRIFMVETVDVLILRKFCEQLVHTVYNLFNTSNIKKIQKTMQN